LPDERPIMRITATREITRYAVSMTNILTCFPFNTDVEILSMHGPVGSSSFFILYIL